MLQSFPVFPVNPAAPPDAAPKEQSTVDPKRRMIPSRQTLRRVNGRAPSDLDVAGVDLILHLMSAVEVIRNSVYTR